MSIWLVWACTAAYAWTAIEQAFITKSYGHAMMFGSYAVANIGIILTMRG